MPFIGTEIGALDALRLITKGPGPPRRAVSGNGASKSSTLRYKLSPVNGVFVGTAMNVFQERLGCVR
jgi:hypothetical protein